MLENSIMQLTLNDASATLSGSQGIPGTSHRKPRRNALTVALWAALGLLLTLVYLSAHRYGYGTALNGGWYWHTPGTPPSWSFGYETYGAPGWFGPDAN